MTGKQHNGWLCSLPMCSSEAPTTFHSFPFHALDFSSQEIFFCETPCKKFVTGNNWFIKYYQSSSIIEAGATNKCTACLLFLYPSNQQAGWRAFTSGENTARAHVALPAVLQQNSPSSEHNQHSCPYRKQTLIDFHKSCE